jgi:hypothetical protein
VKLDKKSASFISTIIENFVVSKDQTGAKVGAIPVFLPCFIKGYLIFSPWLKVLKFFTANKIPY